MSISTVPIVIIDLVFSTLAIILTVTATVIMADLYRANRGSLFFRYLLFMSISLCIFALSRGGGHILRNILIYTSNEQTWYSISPFTGSINTIVFVVLAIIFLLNLDARAMSRAFAELRIKAEMVTKQLQFKVSVLNAMEIPALIIGPDYRVIDANISARLLFNIPEKDGPVYCYRITHGLDSPCEEKGIPCLLKKTFDEQKTFKTIHKHPTVEDEKIHQVIYTPVLMEGRCLCVLETIIDITEDVQREKSVRRKLKEVFEKRQSTALRSLVSGVAHEFNNILAGILGNAEILKYKTEDMPELHKHITPIMESAEKAAQFVRQMTLYTRESPLKRERVDLGQLLDDFINIIKMPERVTLHYERQNSPMFVHADRESLAEALTQIVQNSFDAMPEGGDLFITSAVEKIKAREFAVIKIKDTGQGIPPEHLDHVFEPFFTTKDVGKGTGLGLCLAKGVIEALGGEITISSTPGKGTEVTIRLPLD